MASSAADVLNSFVYLMTSEARLKVLNAIRVDAAIPAAPVNSVLSTPPLM